MQVYFSVLKWKGSFSFFALQTKCKRYVQTYTDSHSVAGQLSNDYLYLILRAVRGSHSESDS